jgi:hypothetical protein
MEDRYSEKDWQKIIDFFKTNFTLGETPSTETIFYLIGVQELGKGFSNFSRDDKINLMHIAVCSVLEPYGYYEKRGIDSDGWPVYVQKKSLPQMTGKELETFYRKAIINYFKKQGLV